MRGALCRGQDLVDYEIGEEEVAEMVSLELAFKPILGLAVWYPSMMPALVNLSDIVPGTNSSGGLPDIGEREQV